MKIVDMRITPVAMADPPLFSSYGLHAPYALRSIVELVSEDGLTGMSETHGGERPLLQLERARPLVTGRSAYDLARLSTRMDALFTDSGPKSTGASDSGIEASQTFILPGENSLDTALRVAGAIEVAALDLIGKATGVPVCDLLGGRVRDEVPFSAYLFYKRPGGGGAGSDARQDEWGEVMDSHAIIREARQMIDQYGFKSIKLKGGVLPPDDEVEAVQALRDTFGPDMPLRIDPNGAWSVEKSVQVGTALAGALEYLEDPVPGVAEMAEVRRRLLSADIDMPLASNNAMTNWTDIPPAFQTNAVQVILSDHHYWGGLRAVTQLGRLCQTFGIGLSMHSNSHLGPSLLAMVHLAAATPHLTFASDTHYPWQQAEDEILAGGRVTICNGAIPVPTAPGLGGELDQDALARGRERYEMCGYRSRDDAREMCQHVDSSWSRQAPRW
jgi:glucarate dehydratase